MSFELQAGETLAIVGESGSGKSVTALSILQLLGDAGSIDKGSILFEGKDLVSIDSDAIRKISGD